LVAVEAGEQGRVEMSKKFREVGSELYVGCRRERL
jgi:hypothetical protein